MKSLSKLAVLLSLSFLLRSNKEYVDFKTIYHKKDKHHAEEFGKTYSRQNGNRRQITIMFLPDSKYTHSHQSSWNKITGRGAPFFMRVNKQWVRIEEDILVWRYTPSCDCFEVGEYHRRKGKMHFPEVIHRMKVYEQRTFSLDFIRRSPTFIGIGAYFGGQLSAPRDLQYYIRIH
jgi:hypothetical protein